MDTRFVTPQSANVDVISLEKKLKQTIAGEVRFDAGSKALYAADASNYRQVPIGLVIPKNREDIVHTMAICAEYGAPVLTRGGGTSLAGQCCNVAVVMDFSKYYHHVLDLNADKKMVKVETGIVLDKIRNFTKQHAKLTFGPDPATHDHCTIGGMLGNNSCGVHSVMAAFEGDGARTSDNVHSLTILTYDGVMMEVGETTPEMFDQFISEGGKKGVIYEQLKNFIDKYADLIRSRFPNIPRRVSGYNLPDLLPENNCNIARALVGSENTCVTILDATLKLLHEPKVRVLLVLGYEDVFAAGHHVMEVMKYEPIGLEGMDDLLIEYMRRTGINVEDLELMPQGNGWLLVEFGGDTKASATKKAKALMTELKKSDVVPAMCLYTEEEQQKKLWEVRESGLGATAWVPGMPVSLPGWEDSAVPPEKVGDYLKDLKNLFKKYGFKPAVYGHFGQGCVHCSIEFDLFTEKGIEQYQKFTREAANIVVGYGGSLSGEHGDGQSRGELLEIMYGKELVQAFEEFKAIWDPLGKMNPGKIVNSYGQVANLRTGTQYNPPHVHTHFHYSDDDNNFAKASFRCAGVGKCRRQDSGTMCPSYMVTMEEKHSTRGRARMLFEMMQGDVVKDGWKDEHVKDSLDLCLSCKGCKHDCPVSVDMATYKSEFLAHYYKGKLRPRTAYTFGWIYWWSRMASLAPGIANFFTQTPIIRDVVKFAGGIAPQRTMPKFAAQTFREWFRNRNRKSVATKKVILWADTFNNFFLPETLIAGVAVLEAAGYKVIIPKQMLCCGRPLYDFGMLKTAKKLLSDILTTLKAEIENGTPVVGLEPSCVAVFRDELCNLFPDNEDAKRLKKQTFTLAEFLKEYAPDFMVPEIRQKALVHGHCHHKAIMHLDADKNILDETKLDYEMLDSGCCGMAGYFGYEKGQHYDVSIQAGERVLLPKVREASKKTLIIADGFSCREQIEQETDRKGMHLAQVLQMGLMNDGTAAQDDYPEKKFVDDMKLRDNGKTKKALLLLAGIGLAFVAANLIVNRKNKPWK